MIMKNTDRKYNNLVNSILLGKKASSWASSEFFDSINFGWYDDVVFLQGSPSGLSVGSPSPFAHDEDVFVILIPHVEDIWTHSVDFIVREFNDLKGVRVWLVSQGAYDFLFLFYVLDGIKADKNVVWDDRHNAVSVIDGVVVCIEGPEGDQLVRNRAYLVPFVEQVFNDNQVSSLWQWAVDLLVSVVEDERAFSFESKALASLGSLIVGEVNGVPVIGLKLGNDSRVSFHLSVLALERVEGEDSFGHIIASVGREPVGEDGVRSLRAALNEHSHLNSG